MQPHASSELSTQVYGKVSGIGSEIDISRIFYYARALDDLQKVLEKRLYRTAVAKMDEKWSEDGKWSPAACYKLLKEVMMTARGVLQHGGICTIFVKSVNNRLSESVSKSLAMTSVHVCCASYLYIKSVGLIALKKKCQPVITYV